MWKIETTKGWDKAFKTFLESNPNEMGLLLASLIRYQALLNACRTGIRPQMAGLTEENMGIVAVRQFHSESNLLVAYAYPDPDPKNKVVVYVIIGKEIDRDSDMEYVKQCVSAYQN